MHDMKMTRIKIHKYKFILGYKYTNLNMQSATIYQIRVDKGVALQTYDRNIVTSH